MSEWRAMKSAPRDGRTIIVKWRHPKEWPEHTRLGFAWYRTPESVAAEPDLDEKYIGWWTWVHTKLCKRIDPIGWIEAPSDDVAKPAESKPGVIAEVRLTRSSDMGTFLHVSKPGGGGAGICLEGTALESWASEVLHGKDLQSEPAP